MAKPDCVAALDQYLSPLFIQFDVGGSSIPSSALTMLSDISNKISACNGAYVQIAGHSDSTGDDSINLTLSWDRADNTLEALVAMGVNTTAIETLGFGARAPLSQGSASGDPANRWVDFRVSRQKVASE